MSSENDKEKNKAKEDDKKIGRFFFKIVDFLFRLFIPPAPCHLSVSVNGKDITEN